MGLWDGIKRQLRSVIEWKDSSKNELFYCWSDNGDEIKNASNLIVGPGQGCIFVYQGRVVSVIETEGTVSLLTDNIPFWTTIKKVMQGFESEHKVGLYFFKRTIILDQKWGTLSPIKYDDPHYKFPVGLVSFGNFSFVISNAQKFFTTIVGQQEHYLVSDFREAIVNRLSQPIADYLAEKRLSYAQIDAMREEIAYEVQQRLYKEFTDLGFELTDFRIEGTDFDDATQQRISRIADVTADTHAADVAGVSYSEFQRLSAMKDAANNEAGAAGMMMGMGVGGGLASQTVPSPQENKNIKSRLHQLKELYDGELITEQEYNEKKSTLLSEL